MAEEKKITLFVLDGQSVQHDGKSYGPGESLELGQADAKRLVSLGVALTEAGVKKLAAQESETPIVSSQLDNGQKAAADDAAAAAAAAAADGGEYQP